MMPFQAMRLRNPGPPPPASFKNFELLFEGANGSTSITDTFGNTVTNTSNLITISTAQAFGGSSSGSFPASASQKLSAADTLAAFGSGDFRLSAAVRPATVTGQHMIATTRAVSGSDPGFFWWLNGTEIQFVFWGPTAGTVALDIKGGALTLNTWTQLDVQRVGSSFTIFQDGVSIATGTSSAAMALSSNALCIGTDPSTGGRTFSGYMDNFRVYKGGIT